MPAFGRGLQAGHPEEKQILKLGPSPWILALPLPFSTSVLARLVALAQCPGVCSYLLESLHSLTNVKQWLQPLGSGTWELDRHLFYT